MFLILLKWETTSGVSLCTQTHTLRQNPFSMANLYLETWCLWIWILWSLEHPRNTKHHTFSAGNDMYRHQGLPNCIKGTQRFVSQRCQSSQVGAQKLLISKVISRWCHWIWLKYPGPWGWIGRCQYIEWNGEYPHSSWKMPSKIRMMTGGIPILTGA